MSSHDDYDRANPGIRSTRRVMENLAYVAEVERVALSIVDDFAMYARITPETQALIDALIVSAGGHPTVSLNERRQG